MSWECLIGGWIFAFKPLKVMLLSALKNIINKKCIEKFINEASKKYYSRKLKSLCMTKINKSIKEFMTFIRKKI